MLKKYFILVFSMMQSNLKFFYLIFIWLNMESEINKLLPKEKRKNSDLPWSYQAYGT